MSQKEVGEISYYLSTHLNWKISRFSEIPHDGGSRLWSPKFGFLRETRNFVGAPIGWRSYLLNTRWIKLSLTSEINDANSVDCVRVGVTNESGEEINTCYCVWNYSYGGFDGINLVREDELALRHKGEIQNGYLQLFCEIPSKTCRPTSEDASQTEFEYAYDRLSENFKDLLLKELDTDLTIKVKGRTFRVHGHILRARSPIFDSILTESDKNVIQIEDCEPEIFKDLLVFIYTGKTEISFCNASHFYALAYKYNLPDLKHVCMSFLKRKISVENIFYIFSFAKRNNEVELLNLTVNYFAKNMTVILTTSKWLFFMKGKPDDANELVIKGLELGFTKKET